MLEVISYTAESFAEYKIGRNLIAAKVNPIDIVNREKLARIRKIEAIRNDSYMTLAFDKKCREEYVAPDVCRQILISSVSTREHKKNIIGYVLRRELLRGDKNYAEVVTPDMLIEAFEIREMIQFWRGICHDQSFFGNDDTTRVKYYFLGYFSKVKEIKIENNSYMDLRAILNFYEINMPQLTIKRTKKEQNEHSVKCLVNNFIRRIMLNVISKCDHMNIFADEYHFVEDSGSRFCLFIENEYLSGDYSQIDELFAKISTKLMFGKFIKLRRSPNTYTFDEPKNIINYFNGKRKFCVPFLDKLREKYLGGYEKIKARYVRNMIDKISHDIEKLLITYYAKYNMQITKIGCQLYYHLHDENIDDFIADEYYRLNKPGIAFDFNTSLLRDVNLMRITIECYESPRGNIFELYEPGQDYYKYYTSAEVPQMIEYLKDKIDLESGIVYNLGDDNEIAIMLRGHELDEFPSHIRESIRRMINKYNQKLGFLDSTRNYLSKIVKEKDGETTHYKQTDGVDGRELQFDVNLRNNNKLVVETKSRRFTEQIVYKSCKTQDDRNCLVILKLFEDSLVAKDGASYKMRTNKCKVMGIHEILQQNDHITINSASFKSAKSLYSSSFMYELNKVAFEPKFNPDLNQVCTHGLHFFATPEKAINYNLHIEGKILGLDQIMTTFNLQDDKILELPAPQKRENNEIDESELQLRPEPKQLKNLIRRNDKEEHKTSFPNLHRLLGDDAENADLYYQMNDPPAYVAPPPMEIPDNQYADYLASVLPPAPIGADSILDLFPPVPTHDLTPNEKLALEPALLSEKYVRPRRVSFSDLMRTEDNIGEEEPAAKFEFAAEDINEMDEYHRRYFYSCMITEDAVETTSSLGNVDTFVDDLIGDNTSISKIKKFISAVIGK